MIEQEFFTPPQIAAILGVNRANILRAINRGDLRASDVSMGQGLRPRWRISRSDLESFLARRANTPKPVRQNRKNSKDDGIVRIWNK